MKPLSVYIHIPFCEKRCGYCDFLSCCDLNLIDEYLVKLTQEINMFDFHDYEIKTIYIGGGTPSILSVRQIDILLASLPKCDGEISIEVNPNSLTEEKCKIYKNYGINRISIGVQSFDNDTLRSLGRVHDANQAIEAIILANLYFNNISIDLIKDIPNYKFVQPQDDVLNMIKHISIYSLMKNDEPVVQYDEKVLLPQTYKRYEVSNYAIKGYESRHNLVYWTGGEYIGFGAGAHSFMKNRRFYNSEDILNYKKIFCKEPTPEEVTNEKIMLGLRLKSGFNINLLKNKDAELKLLKDTGFIKIKNNQVMATKKGFKMLNQIWLKLT